MPLSLRRQVTYQKVACPLNRVQNCNNAIAVDQLFSALFIILIILAMIEEQIDTVGYRNAKITLAEFSQKAQQELR